VQRASAAEDIGRSRVVENRSCRVAPKVFGLLYADVHGARSITKTLLRGARVEFLYHFATQLMRQLNVGNESGTNRGRISDSVTV
jgi:hypothetical protein